MPALPSSSGSKNGADRWRSGARGKVSADDIRQVVEVDEDFVDPRAVKRVEPDVKQGPVIDGQHAFRDGVRDRPQPAADSRREQEGFHLIRPPDDPERTHPSVGLGQHSVETVHALKPRGICRDRFGRRTLGLPAQSSQSALMSERMCRVSPKRYSPVTTPAWREPYWRMTMSANSLVVTALAAAHVEDPPGGAVVLQYQHIGVYHVVDVDVVADRRTILVESRRHALQVAQAEDAAGPGVGVVDRLPRPWTML